MKAISIKQPWASLIVEGIKDIENRTWPCPKKYIGQRVLIHASKTHLASKGLFPIEQFLSIPSDLFPEIGNKLLQTGAIIGSVEIVGCVFNHESIWAEKSQMFLGSNIPYEPIYNWVLANPVKFETPIPAKGRLSFWEAGFEICNSCFQPLPLDDIECDHHF